MVESEVLPGEPANASVDYSGKPGLSITTSRLLLLRSNEETVVITTSKGQATIRKSMRDKFGIGRKVIAVELEE